MRGGSSMAVSGVASERVVWANDLSTRRSPSSPTARRTTGRSSSISRSASPTRTTRRGGPRTHARGGSPAARPARSPTSGSTRPRLDRAEQADLRSRAWTRASGTSSRSSRPWVSPRTPSSSSAPTTGPSRRGQRPALLRRERPLPRDQDLRRRHPRPDDRELARQDPAGHDAARPASPMSCPRSSN